MKRLLAFLVIIFSCWLPVHAQRLHVDSTRFITGLHVGTLIQFAIPTADKGILFAGEDYDNPGGIIPYFPLDTGENGNVMVGKIDSNHQISWIKVYGGSDADGAGPACQTPDGGYAILANTLSNNGDVTGFKGASDIWLLRLDKDGNLLWERCYGSSQSDGATSIANTPDHGLIILGTTNGNDGDVPFNYGDFFTMDWLVIKTDSVGNVQWSKDLGSTGDETPTGSILSVDSSYYLIGSTDSKDYDCTDTAWHAGVYTGDDYHVLKLNDTGKVLWDSSYGGSANDIVNYALYDIRDSTIVMIGTTNSSDFMVSGYHECQDMGDYWVTKIKKDGTLLWERALGSIQQEAGKSVCVAPRGNYVAYGTTFPYDCRDSTIGDIGFEDCLAFILDSSGNIISKKIFGGINGDEAFSIVPYLNGFAAFGLSASKIFNEGPTYGNFDSVGGPFVSYIDTNSLEIINANAHSAHLLSVYPNPGNSVITITAAENNEGMLVVINAMGQVVLNEEVRSLQSVHVHTQAWNDGVYLIKWCSADGMVQTAKFVKM